MVSIHVRNMLQAEKFSSLLIEEKLFHSPKYDKIVSSHQQVVLIFYLIVYWKLN